MVVIKLAIVLLVIVAGAVLHQVGQLLAVHPAVRAPRLPRAPRPRPSLLQDLGFAPGRLRDQRHLHRRRAGVLRLHRLRHRRHRGRGDQEPAAGHADRHPVLAGDLHGALRRGLARRHRHGEVHRDQGRRAAGRGVPVGRPSRLRDGDLGRRAGRPDHRDDDPDARAEPGLLRDEPRPAAAAGRSRRSARGSAPRCAPRSSPASWSR